MERIRYERDVMINFSVHTISLLSSAFSLGGVSYLYMRYRTKILRLVLLFLLSLFSISLGFWFGSPIFREAGISGEGLGILCWIFQFIGGGLNIVVLPYLVSILLGIPLSTTINRLLGVWDGSFVVLAASWFLFPSASLVPVFLSIQQIVTILGCLIFMGIGMRRLRQPWWRHAFLTFFVISSAFLLLLILDIMISNLSITVLQPFDNLSLPLYLVALNSGTFLFAGKYLSRDALVQDGRLTSGCIEFYGLTPREVEIVEELLAGRSNKQIAGRLSISAKTVENHLYNIYQKTGAGGRSRLIHTLHSWSSEKE